MECLSNYHKDHINQNKNSHKLCSETGHPILGLKKTNENWDNNMIRISQWIKSHCRTNTSVRRKKGAGLWESQSGIWVGKLTLDMVICICVVCMYTWAIGMHAWLLSCILGHVRTFPFRLDYKTLSSELGKKNTVKLCCHLCS